MLNSTLRQASLTVRILSRALLLIGLLGLSGFAAHPPLVAQAATRPASAGPGIPAANVLNPDGTLNLAKGQVGTVDVHGWNVQLDPRRGPVFSPLAPATAAWTPVGGGTTDWVLAVAVSGTDVYVGGTFLQVCGDSACTGGSVTNVNHVARWNGSSWSALGHGVDRFVRALTISGTDVYVGGQFTNVCGDSACLTGNVPVNNIAKWNGNSWIKLAHGLDADVYAIAVSGNTVYAGGIFQSDCGDDACATSPHDFGAVAKWSGSSWSGLGAEDPLPSTDSTVDALAASGNDLYVGGLFNRVFIGGGGSLSMTVNNITRWDGAGWHALGNGVSDQVYALALSENDLYVGGKFIQLCGNITCNSANITVNNIARWNSGWFALGNGLDSQANALAVSGSDVYAGGAFVHACGTSVCNSGNATVNRVAKWDGGSWSALGQGVDSIVRALAVNGGAVYGGGYFSNGCGNSACNSQNVTLNHIARYGALFDIFLPFVRR